MVLLYKIIKYNTTVLSKKSINDTIVIQTLDLIDNEHRTKVKKLHKRRKSYLS